MKIKGIYTIIDGQNDDIVYDGDSACEALEAYNEYDEECEGDWDPIQLKRGKDMSDTVFLMDAKREERRGINELLSVI